MKASTLDASVKVEILSLPSDVSRFDLVAKYLHLRKQVFVDQLEWPLHHAEGIEFEQYDTFNTAYVIAHSDGEVLGGARLKRTEERHGDGNVVYSYMIRDAHLGLLDGMPGSLCYKTPPVDPRTWELTRFATLSSPGIAEKILSAANEYLFNIGAEECLFLGPPSFLRMASRLGWEPRPLGDVVKNTDGTFLAFSCCVRHPQSSNSCVLRKQLPH